MGEEKVLPIPQYLQDFMASVESLPQVEVLLIELGPYAKVMLRSFVQYRLKRLKEDLKPFVRNDYVGDIACAYHAYRRWEDSQEMWEGVLE